MAISLTNQTPAATYNTLLVTDGVSVYNGVGTQLTSLDVTASYAESASYVSGGTGTLLTTGSTYPITSSWSVSSLSASYITSSNIVGDITSLSSSWASSSISSSYATSASYAPGGTGTSLTTGSTYPITSSWSVSSLSSSYPWIMIGSGAVMSDDPNNIRLATNAGQFSYTVEMVQIGSQAGYHSTYATRVIQIGKETGYNSTNANYAIQIGYRAGYNSTYSDRSIQIGYEAGYNAISGSFTTLIGPNADALDPLLHIEKSIAIGYNAKVSASNTAAIGGIGVDAVKVTIGGTSATNTLDVVGNISCSVITASLFYGTSSNSFTASYITSSNIVGDITSLSSSWASSSISSSYATSASYAPGGTGTLLTTGSTYPITSSWSNNSLSASYLSGSVVTRNITSNNGLIVSSGNVGIGTLTPTTLLHVNGNAGFGTGQSTTVQNNSQFSIHTNPDKNFVMVGSNGFPELASINDAFNLYTELRINGSSLRLNNATSGVIEMATAGSKVGIGTASPVNKLDVVGNISCGVITASLYGTVIGSSMTMNYSSTMSIDFNAAMFHSSSLTNNVYLTGSNLGIGKMASIKLTATGSQNCNIYYPSNWVWLGTPPYTLSSSKVAIVSLTCYGNDDLGIVGAYASQL